MLREREKSSCTPLSGLHCRAGFGGGRMDSLLFRESHLLASVSFINILILREGKEEHKHCRIHSDPNSPFHQQPRCHILYIPYNSLDFCNRISATPLVPIHTILVPTRTTYLPVQATLLRLYQIANLSRKILGSLRRRIIDQIRLGLVVSLTVKAGGVGQWGWWLEMEGGGRIRLGGWFGSEFLLPFYICLLGISMLRMKNIGER